MPIAAQPATVSDAAAGRRASAHEAQKRSFLRMVSHELRTPLNSILGFSEILTSELYGPLGAPEYREYAQIIQNSGHKLLNLVNQLLEIARLEAHAADFDMRPEPIGPALAETVAGLGRELEARRVRVTVADQDPPPVALADPRGLRTVLANLIQNAAAFSPEGGEVRVRAETDGGSVTVVVEDDGEGVDPAELPRLLRPFEQGESALGRRTEGAGLGLAICHLTCQAMGGQLRLDSTPGRGLTARVRLRTA